MEQNVAEMIKKIEANLWNNLIFNLVTVLFWKKLFVSMVKRLFSHQKMGITNQIADLRF